MALARVARTDDELTCALGMSPNSQRPRRIELVRDGYVQASTRRRQSHTGHWSTIWEITEAGIEVLRRNGLLE
jgi:hypothetical protein